MMGLRGADGSAVGAREMAVEPSAARAAGSIAWVTPAGVFRRIVSTCLVALCLSLVFMGASASATTTYVDGISDQSLPAWDGGFSGSYFAGFFHGTWVGSPPSHVTLARYVVQWNVMSGSYPAYRAEFESWLTDISSWGLTPDLALTSYNSTYPGSSSEYKSRLEQILNQARTMGHPIRYLEAWNEPNNQGHESATNAAHFTNEGYSACQNTYACTIIAGNLEDTTTVGAYEDEYRTHLNPVPTIWGVHPYYSVEERSETPFQHFVEHLPNGGSGDQIWLTEIAARKCQDFNGLKENGEIGQAERAKWLVDTLMRNRSLEHVFYYEFMLKEHKQPSCVSEGADDALYLPGSDPNAPDYPRPAASFVWNGKSVPWGYTGGVTEVQPKQATLTGSIYPGGFLAASYHFEYGTTSGYGLYSTEGHAGSGSGDVGGSLTVPLEPGTTYHYRIVAWSSEGSTGGEDRTFTTPGPVEAVTGTASGVKVKQATLNGTVNPRGYDAKYYFQYGVSVGYGSATPEGDAGAGGSPVPESAIITGLQPGTTYHYRLVATSGGVTSYGTDQVVTTVIMAPPSVVVYWNGTQDVYYTGTNGQLQYWYWNGSIWTPAQLGYTNAVIGGPSANLLSSGAQDIYYNSPAGQLQYWYWSGSSWSPGQIGYTNKIAGSPSAVVLPNGSQDVFYRGTDGALWDQNINSNGTIGSLRQWGETGKIAGDPTAVVQQSNGGEDVYYRGTDGALWDWYINGASWTLRQWGETGKVAGNPSVAMQQSNGSRNVYYRGTDGALWDWYINGSSWTLRQWGYTGKLAGNPSAVLASDGSEDIFYRGPEGALWYWYIKGSTWNLQQLGAIEAVGGDPTAVISPSGLLDVYYGSASEQILYWWNSGGGWYTGEP